MSASAINALDEDPSLAKLLAVAAAGLADPTIETIATLHRAWAADRVIARPGPTYDLSVRFADVDPNGLRMAVAGASAGDGSGKVLDVVDLATEETAWEFRVDQASAWVISPRFNPTDGEHVTAGVFWDPHNLNRLPSIERGATVDEPPPDLVGVLVWDASTGQLVERYDVGPCGGYPSGISATHVLVRTLYGPPDVIAACDWAHGTLGAELVDRRTGERRLLTENSLTHRRGAAMSGDGSTVAYDDIDAERHDLVVADVLTGAQLLRLTPAPAEDWGVRGLSYDGSLLLYGGQPVEVWDVAAGARLAAFDGHVGGSGYAAFSRSARTVLSTGVDGDMREWDVATGDELRVFPGIGEGPVAATSDGRILTIGHSGSNATPPLLVDVGAHGELGAVDTCAGIVAPDSLKVAGDLAVFHTVCNGELSATTYVVDARAQRVLYTLPGHQAQALAVSPDGTMFVRQDGEGRVHGPLIVRDLRTSAELVELEGLCSWDAASPIDAAQQPGCTAYPQAPFGISAQRLTWSPDGTMIAAVAADAVDGDAIVVWDATTGALLYADQPDPDRRSVFDVRFTPDTEQLLTTSNDQKHRVISTRTWEVLSTGIGSTNVGIVGFSPDGDVLVALQLMLHTGASLLWFDGDTQQIEQTRSDIHEGWLWSVTLSPDGTLVATAASDGFVRVWEAATLELVHEIPLGDTPIVGVAFVDDQHLAVTPRDGDLVLVTIDQDELLEIVRRSLTRGFTATECSRFGFADECPTLAELRTLPDISDDPAVLDGAFEIRWTDQQFENALAAAGEPTFGTIRLPQDGYPGTYTVTFDEGRFDIVHDEKGVFCTGSYTVTGDRVQMFAERREWLFGCPPGRFLNATFALADDALTLTNAIAHPVDEVLLTSQPLTRLGE